MELSRLRYFLAAADELSFRRAADVVGVNQSAVSRQIAALEDELGVTLFERRSTGARLTEVGRVFLADARRIVADVDRARETIAAVAFGTEGRLRLAICEDATTPTFAAIIAAHRERCPAVTLDLFEIPNAMQPAALRRGEIDAGLLLPPVRRDGIQLDELWREDWLVAMPSDHRFVDMETVSIGDLAGENFITAHPEFGPGCHAQSQDIFVAAGIQPRIVARAFRRLTMAMLVQSGAGVTLVPGAFSGVAMDGIMTRPLSSEGHRMCVAAAYPEGDMQGIVAQFLRTASAAVTTFQAQ
ncbi:LysR substrate-binding domain-containing protein [Algihabitans albus]|uniref:LysR substrate-binding domain-containing protein n=1 Tax=Algihabitans albus TaxID=2164067 RepID=UPI000E5C9BD1|nr:LysR substrate-binding domain-containing protein [Algihabitans albus]MBO6921981.1 LysR family transcriptional regulator [Roseicyclus sp.]